MSTSIDKLSLLPLLCPLGVSHEEFKGFCNVLAMDIAHEDLMAFCTVMEKTCASDFEERDRTGKTSASTGQATKTLGLEQAQIDSVCLDAAAILGGSWEMYQQCIREAKPGESTEFLFLHKVVQSRIQDLPARLSREKTSYWSTKELCALVLQQIGRSNHPQKTPSES